MNKSPLFLAIFIATALFSTPKLVQAEQLIESRESMYNNIYIYEIDGLTHMRFSLNERYYTESIYNPNNELALPATYARYLSLSTIYPEKIERILVIGLGGGRTSWYLHKHMPDVEITAVELDPDVIDLATKHFGISESENYKIVEKDGRSFLMRDKSKYDIIIIDAYRGPFVPFHLLTKEFFRLVKEHLNEGGVAVQNIEPTTMLFSSAVATIKSEFQSIDFYDASGNIVAIAYDAPRISNDLLTQQATALQNQFKFHYPLQVLLLKRRFFTPAPDIKVLTDDFAPVNTLKAIDRHNIKWDD